MSDPSRTEPELIEEISALKKRIQELEQAETERKRLEEELRFSRQQLRLFIDAGPDFFFLKDLNLRYQLVNSANAGFFGRDEADILGRTDIELMPEWAAIACQESDRLAIREKRIVIAIEPVGERFYETYKFPVVVDDEVVGVAGIIRDITDRKRAEQSLQESEERLNTILSNVGAYIYLKDVQYRYAYVNDKVCNLFGFKEDEIIGKGDARFFSPASVEEIMRSDRRVIEHGETITREETDITSSDQLPRTYWVVKLPLRDSNGNISGLCGISTDITDLKQTEAALKGSESRLSSIIEFLPDATFVIDLEGKIISWNKAIEEMTGFSAETMLGKGNYEYAIPFYGERRPILVNLLFLWEDDIVKKYSFVKKDGDTLYTEADAPRVRGQKMTIWAKASPLRNENGDVIGAIESIRDITDRKRAEEALQEAKDYTENLIKSANVLIVGLDVDGKVTLLNEAGEKITGYKADDVVGKNWFEFIVPKDTYPYVWDEFNKLIDAGATIDTFENPIKTKFGDERIISWKNSTLKQGGKFIGTISFGMDITEHEQAQKEREKLILELREALHKVKMLSGLLPVCASCKKIRNDKGYWEQMEIYIRDHSEADFSHGICPECAEKLYPQYYKKNK